MSYIVNEQAETLAARLVEGFHTHLTGIKIAHLLKVKPEGYDHKTAMDNAARKPRASTAKITLAKTARVSPKMNALASQDFKFVIEYDQRYWDELTSDEKTALVDHELCHCGRDDKGCYLKPHSVEEFREIINRYGFWKNDLKLFAQAMERVLHGDELVPVESLIVGETVNEATPERYLEEVSQ